MIVDPNEETMSLLYLRCQEVKILQALAVIQFRYHMNNVRKILVETPLNNSNGFKELKQLAFNYGNLFIRLGGSVAAIHQDFPECKAWTFNKE